MSVAECLAVIGFDSISLPFLETFVCRGVMPTVKRLMAEGSVTQTWPCLPMETATNWACLATGATPAVHGCNMHMPEPGGPADRAISAFPAGYCHAEQLWTAAHRAGKRSVVFDWGQSYPLAFEDGIIHVGEDGRPNYAIKALQESCAYTTDVRIPESFHVRRIAPVAARGWPASSDGDLEFEVTITPTLSVPGWRNALPTKYRTVSSLYARIRKGAEGFEAVAIYPSKAATEPLLTVRLGEWSGWAKHTFIADGEPVTAHVRAKLLRLSPDGREVHLYLSEIYPAEGFVHPVAWPNRSSRPVGLTSSSARASRWSSPTPVTSRPTFKSRSTWENGTARRRTISCGTRTGTCSCSSGMVPTGRTISPCT